MAYFLFIYGSNSYIAAVVAYLASEDVLLGHGCVSVFILVSVVAFILRLLILVFARFGLRKLIYVYWFCPLRRGY